MKPAKPSVALLLGLLLTGTAASQQSGELRVFGPLWEVGPALSLLDPGASAVQGKERFELVRKAMFGQARLPQCEVLAFEENPLFTFAAGVFRGKLPREGAGGVRVESLEWRRRFLLLKPGCLVVDDLVKTPAPVLAAGWFLCSTAKAEQIGARRFLLREPAGQLTLETFLPREVQSETLARFPGTGPSGHALAISPKQPSAAPRFLHLMRLKQPEESPGEAVNLEAKEDGLLELDIEQAERSFRLSLPPPDAAAGQIAISNSGQTRLAGPRPLASGILPHTPEGLRLLERWDSAYRDGRRPGWDTGRPSSHLVQAVESGRIRPCRALELGCGLGTNAIWLAGRKFDVSALDIAPSALAAAMEAAQRAKVQLRWLLADVLAPPKLQPFDFIYDRGCYHGVRRTDAAGYVETLRRLTRPASLVLIEAGNANEPGRGGPPRITQEQLQADFSADFDFLELREARFDTADPNRPGALCWLILLQRKRTP
ncbi:MAG: class I SAM-dependent methyltransferase [Thermoguttaceae bacterium]